MVTSKDVAKLANCSVSTVSRAFYKPNMLSKETVDKILRISKELHYIPNDNARNLKNNKSNVIGFVISNINNPFYLKVANHMSSLEENKNLRFFTAFSNEDDDIEFASITSMIASNVAVILFTPTSNSNEDIPLLLKANNIKALQLFRQKYQDISSLVIDDKYGAYLATKELLDNGHTNILLFDYKLSIPTHRDEGFIQAYKENNVDESLGNIVSFDISSQFEEQFYQALDFYKPTAVIPVGNLMATYLLKYLMKNNLDIKNDISIVIYDDVELASTLNITTISHPIEKIAIESTKIIFNSSSESNTSTIHMVLKPFIIKRNSIKKL